MLTSLLRVNLCLILIFAGTCDATDDTLTAFRAEYELFKNDNQIGETLFQIEALDNRLNMRMISKPNGIYGLLTKLQPVTETTLVRRKGDYRLDRIRISPNPGESPHEVVQFDWQRSLLTTSRENKKYQLALTEPVYDYLSIHWLSAQMAQADAKELQVKFYRKGKIMTSRLLHRGTEAVEFGGKTIDATVIEQSFDGSSRRIRYHYDRKNPWLPLRIERSRKGKNPTLLKLKSVQPWTKAE